MLIKKYRELRASGFVGYKLQAALRLNLANSALRRLPSEAAKRVSTFCSFFVAKNVTENSLLLQAQMFFFRKKL